MWLMLFDEIILEQESILFRIDDDVFDVRNMLDQLFGFVRLLIFLEIAAYASVQVFSLTYIDYLSIGIKILIDSRIFGNTLQELGNMFVKFLQFYSSTSIPNRQSRASALPSKYLRPFKPISSMRQFTYIFLTPNFLTSSMAASMDPPVARMSS